MLFVVYMSCYWQCMLLFVGGGCGVWLLCVVMTVYCLLLLFVSCLLCFASWLRVDVCVCDCCCVLPVSCVMADLCVVVVGLLLLLVLIVVL